MIHETLFLNDYLKLNETYQTKLKHHVVFFHSILHGYKPSRDQGHNMCNNIFSRHEKAFIAKISDNLINP